jgi:hypothetical protein
MGMARDQLKTPLRDDGAVMRHVKGLADSVTECHPHARDADS